jgi:ppGpp synthetase/RelA/SpoT-type nucleotidyltranferase
MYSQTGEHFMLMPLDTFAKVLRGRVKKISTKENFIVAQRLKRTSSILLKLQTHRTMRLSAMQDIGGLSAILEDVNEVHKLVDIYRKSKSRHKLFMLNDYISTPKSDGLIVSPIICDLAEHFTFIK